MLSSQFFFFALKYYKVCLLHTAEKKRLRLWLESYWVSLDLDFNVLDRYTTKFRRFSMLSEYSMCVILSKRRLAMRIHYGGTQQSITNTLMDEIILENR